MLLLDRGPLNQVTMRSLGGMPRLVGMLEGTAPGDVIVQSRKAGLGLDRMSGPVEVRSPSRWEGVCDDGGSSALGGQPCSGYGGTTRVVVLMCGPVQNGSGGFPSGTRPRRRILHGGR